MSKKKIIVFAGLLLLAGAAIAVMTGGNFIVSMAEFVGLSSKSEGGNFTVQQTLGKNIGVDEMSGGDYTMTGDISSVADASKLETDLKKAHCYPNPYKPSEGHTKITFSHLTSYTKLKVYNIAGELVYDENASTPSGELAWDVKNKDGQKLASGVYIFFVSDNASHKAKGKFAVIK